MATSTLAETEVPAKAAAPNMFTRSAAARPMATAK